METFANTGSRGPRFARRGATTWAAVAAVILSLGCESPSSPAPEPAKVAFVAEPMAATAGSQIIPEVQVAIQDASGITVTTSALSVTVAIANNPSGGTLSGTMTVNAVNGLAVFSNISIDKAGAGYTLAASATGLAGATSNAFDVRPAAAAKLQFTAQPSTTTAATVLSPAVEVTVYDAHDNVVTSGTHTITLTLANNSSGATLSGTTTIGSTNGVATFHDVTIDKAGNGYTLSASSANMPAVISSAFDVTVGTASKLVFDVSPPALFDHGAQPITPAVQVSVRDAGGNRVTSATHAVTLAIGNNPGGASLSGTTTATAINGVATFADLRLDRLGDGYTLTASATSLGVATSSPFSVAVTSYVTFVSVTASGGTPPSPTVGGETPHGTHACGIANNGDAYCWGSNQNGQLGIGTVSQFEVLPRRIAGGIQWAKLDAGSGHTCGISVGGAMYCWGANFYGTLGDGSSGSTAHKSAPTAVAGSLSFASVSAGGEHTCGVTTAGAAYCWGRNFHGQLGNGTTNNQTSPTPVSGGLAFASVAADGEQTCGVTTNNAAYCWGFKGSGLDPASMTPVPVPGGLSFASISVGWSHSCGVTPGNAAYCWGGGGNGQIGDGNQMSRSTPTAVSGELATATLSAGSNYACVVASAAAYCWGQNSSSQLGDGSANDRLSPVAVQGGLSFSVIASGNFHTCAVTTAGAIYCWGSGVLGDGTTMSRVTPVRVQR